MGYFTITLGVVLIAYIVYRTYSIYKIDQEN